MGRHWGPVYLFWGLVVSVVFTGLLIFRWKTSNSESKPEILKFRDGIPEFVGCILKEFGVSSASDVIWAHAVNSKAKLAEALQRNVHFLECDVILRESDGQPIVAHPPATDSDITLKEWINAVVTSGKMVGMKFDFKETRAVKPSLTLMAPVLSKRKDCLLWLNADVIGHPQGHNNWPPVASTEFLSLVSSFFPHAVVSLGWASLWNVNDMIQSMLQLAGHVQQPVVFPVYEPFSRQYSKEIQRILEQTKYSLVLWSTPDKEPDDEFVDALTSKYPYRVFTDL